jgi:cell division protein FtsW
VFSLREYIKGDRYIWFIVLMLSGFGVMAVYSSTGTLAYVKKGGNTEFYLLKHVGILLLSLFILWLAHLVDFRYYSRISQLLLFISLPLLLYTLFFGTEINYAKRWLTIPVIGLRFQTSDLAKMALIMFIARFLSKRQDKVKDAKKTFWPILGWIGLTCLLIAPADLSTAAVLFTTSILLLFLGRVPIKQILQLAGIGAVIFPALIFVLWNYPETMGSRGTTWKSRIESFISADEDGGSYQTQMAKIAITEGGLTGKGPGKSTQRNFLPSPYADFIFAVIIEEYGMLGGLFLLSLYLLFLYRVLLIVRRTPKAFGALLAVGLGISLVMQAFINTGVAVGIFPVTGLPLPLVSMGGTSLFFTSFAFGIILSVSRYQSENPNEAS